MNRREFLCFVTGAMASASAGVAAATLAREGRPVPRGVVLDGTTLQANVWHVPPPMTERDWMLALQGWQNDIRRAALDGRVLRVDARRR